MREIVRYASAADATKGESIDEDGDLIDADGYLIHTAADMGEIDEDATNHNDSHDCSGTYSDELPECEAESDCDDRDAQGHEWVSVTDMGREFGTYSNGGTAHTHYEVCKCCGKYKTTKTPGCQRNPDEALEIIEIEDRDEASESWLKRVHDEDGWIPQWLAEYLDCPPTVRMTEDEAKEYVADHSDEDDLDEDDLEHAFAAIFGRRADDKDRSEGLWSHLNA